jgi:dihydrolipoamide dehydrogenase
MSGNGKSIISREERSFIKVLYEEESKKIIGASMMCARATDMISEFTLAIEKGMTLQDMSSIIRPHPTYAEGITEAVEAGLGCSIHSAPARKLKK